MTTNYLQGAGQWLGLAKETTYGVAVATPTIWVPVDSPKWSRKITPLKDQLLRGEMGKTYEQVQGMSYTEVDYKTYIYGDSAFQHFLAMLGVADAVNALAAPVATLGTTASTGGTFAAGTYFWKVTAVDAVGSESAASNELTATLVANGTQTFSWGSISGAVKYNVYRGTAAGAENVLVASPTGLTYTDTGIAGTAGVTPPPSGAFNHATSLLNTIDATHSAQPPSYTGFIAQSDGTARQIPGMIASSLKFTLKANEDPTLDVTWVGLNSNSITAPTNTPSQLQNMPPFTGQVLVGGTALTKYSGVAINITRDVKPVPVLNGVQNPGAIFGGPVTVTGTLDAIYQGSTDNDLANYIANTQPSLAVSLTGQGDPTHPLTLQMSQVAYDSADPAPSATDWLTIQSNIEALMNPTDALDGKQSPIQVSLKNTSSTRF